MSLLKTQNLSKVYRTDTVETTALNDVSLNIGAGEFVAIMGPSGCGKSTLLNIIGLLDSPSSGQYLVNGEDVSGYNERKRAEVRKSTIGFDFSRDSSPTLSSAARARRAASRGACPENASGSITLSNTLRS